MVDQIFVPQGTTVVIAIQASNRNKALWGDDAHQWNPERWLSSLPDSVLNARIPGVYSSLCVHRLPPCPAETGMLTSQQHVVYRRWPLMHVSL